jgi:hypothetical protein
MTLTYPLMIPFKVTEPHRTVPIVQPIKITKDKATTLKQRQTTVLTPNRIPILSHFSNFS